jgi:hypothetical protein
MGVEREVAGTGDAVSADHRWNLEEGRMALGLLLIG